MYSLAQQTIDKLASLKWYDNKFTLPGYKPLNADADQARLIKAGQEQAAIVLETMEASRAAKSKLRAINKAIRESV